MNEKLPSTVYDRQNQQSGARLQLGRRIIAAYRKIASDRKREHGGECPCCFCQVFDLERPDDPIAELDRFAEMDEALEQIGGRVLSDELPEEIQRFFVAESRRTGRNREWADRLEERLDGEALV